MDKISRIYDPTFAEKKFCWNEVRAAPLYDLKFENLEEEQYFAMNALTSTRHAFSNAGVKNDLIKVLNHSAGNRLIDSFTNLAEKAGLSPWNYHDDK